MKRKSRKSFIIFLLLFSAFILYAAYLYGENSTEEIVQVPQSIESTYGENHPLYFGNPSNATAEVDDETNQLLEKSQYVLSYNNINLGPNWVAWHLSASDLGDSGRSNKFIADKTLPAGWYAVKQNDYQFAAYGFDRGHVCPSADRTLTPEDNQSTFYMTNMLPQAPDCNRIVWKDLESYERQLALEGNELYIFAGGVGRGGIGNRGYFEEIVLSNNQTILVPEFCWKILVILPEGENDFTRMATDAKILSVCVPNQQGCQNTGSWEQYECSINYIEEITQLDFLDLLPDDLEEILED